MNTYEDIIFPEAINTVIGSKVKILDNGQQAWLKPGQILTIKEVYRNSLRFEESKYAWKCPENNKNKFFRVSIRNIPEHQITRLPTIEQIYYYLDVLIMKIVENR
jgi:hypothetical protein